MVSNTLHYIFKLFKKANIKGKQDPRNEEKEAQYQTDNYIESTIVLFEKYGKWW